MLRCDSKLGARRTTRCAGAQVPPSMKFYLEGEMPDYLLAKDIILQVRSV